MAIVSAGVIVSFSVLMIRLVFVLFSLQLESDAAMTADKSILEIFMFYAYYWDKIRKTK